MNTKAMFQRMLAGWATDVLALRKRGWDRPCLRLTGSSRRSTGTRRNSARKAA